MEVYKFNLLWDLMSSPSKPNSQETALGQRGDMILIDKGTATENELSKTDPHSALHANKHTSSSRLVVPRNSYSSRISNMQQQIDTSDQASLCNKHRHAILRRNNSKLNIQVTEGVKQQLGKNMDEMIQRISSADLLIIRNTTSRAFLAKSAKRKRSTKTNTAFDMFVEKPQDAKRYCWKCETMTTTAVKELPAVMDSITASNGQSSEESKKKEETTAALHGVTLRSHWDLNLTRQ